MWDDLLRMEGSSSAGRQYHLCILRRWTIQHYKALQRSTIVSLQDRERWHEAIDKKCGGRDDDDDDISRFNIQAAAVKAFSRWSWCSSCWAQLRKTVAHPEADKIIFVKHSWVPVPRFLPPSPSSRCVCPTSSSLWSPVTEHLPASSAHNNILSVTHREEVLQGKKRVSKP